MNELNNEPWSPMDEWEKRWFEWDEQEHRRSREHHQQIIQAWENDPRLLQISQQQALYAQGMRAIIPFH